MANICTTEYHIHGTKDAITTLWNGLKEINADTQEVSLLEVTNQFGIDPKTLYLKGNVVLVENDSDEENDWYHIHLITNTGWTACNELFNKINRDKCNNDLSISYREIEVGCGIFNVHDEAEYFCEECCVSAHGEQFDEDMYEELFDTIKDAIDFWCERMNHTFDENITQEEKVKFINHYKYDDDDEVFFYINEFDFI